MKRKDLLERALLIVEERGNEYGDARSTLDHIANMWAAYLDTPVSAADVAIMNMQQKMVRLRSAQGQHQDSWIDLAGYAAIGSEAVYEEEMEQEELRALLASLEKPRSKEPAASKSKAKGRAKQKERSEAGDVR